MAQEYSCAEITIQVQEGATTEKKCYDSLFPITNKGKAMFLDAMTMSLVENRDLHSVNCDHHETAVISPPKVYTFKLTPTSDP